MKDQVHAGGAGALPGLEYHVSCSVVHFRSCYYAYYWLKCTRIFDFQTKNSKSFRELRPAVYPIPFSTKTWRWNVVYQCPSPRSENPGYAYAERGDKNVINWYKSVAEVIGPPPVLCHSSWKRQDTAVIKRIVCLRTRTVIPEIRAQWPNSHADTAPRDVGHSPSLRDVPSCILSLATTTLTSKTYYITVFLLISDARIIN